MSDQLPPANSQTPTPAAGFFARAFSDDAGVPSSTRLEMGLVVITICFFFSTLAYVTIRTLHVPDVPANTIAVIALIPTILGLLKNRKDAQTSTTGATQPPSTP